jgi:integrase
MKLALTQPLVWKLTINAKPVESDGQVRFEDNPASTPYIVFDASPKAPPGFGLKVHKSGASYLVQRRVGDKVIKAKVCDVKDLPLTEARTAAGAIAEEMRRTGANPNTRALARQRTEAASKLTLEGALSIYRRHVTSRATPAKPNTLKVLDATNRRLAELLYVPLQSMRSGEVLDLFDRRAAQARTATEQAFRYAHVATRYAMSRDAFDAHQEGREPQLTHNPFQILVLEQKWRSTTQMETDYQRRGSRNPMGEEDGSLGRFLIALWQRRKHNQEGADFLLLTLLCGTRISELPGLCWRDRLTDDEARTMPWVDLDRRWIWIADTKNHSIHELPVADAALELMKRRMDERGKERYVFPPRFKDSKRCRTPHLSDSSTLLEYVRVDAQIPVLRQHDLRRTFGRFAEEHASYRVVKALLNHRDVSDTTSRYTEAEVRRLREAMQKIELAILANAPVIYNGLLSLPTYPRLPPFTPPGPPPGAVIPPVPKGKLGRTKRQRTSDGDRDG